MEIPATLEITGEAIFVYTLKSNTQPKPLSSSRIDPNPPYIQVGYFGYHAGCWYWGTLFTANDGTELFVIATGVNAILNSPICIDGDFA